MRLSHRVVQRDESIGVCAEDERTTRYDREGFGEASVLERWLEREAEVALDLVRDPVLAAVVPHDQTPRAPGEHGVVRRDPVAAEHDVSVARSPDGCSFAVPWQVEDRVRAVPEEAGHVVFALVRPGALLGWY